MDVQNNTSHLHKLLQQKGHALSRDIDVGQGGGELIPQKLPLSAQFGFLNVGSLPDSGHRISINFNVVQGSIRPIAEFSKSQFGRNFCQIFYS